ncbi:MAG TPA: hypothetical protein VHB50_07050 [Bryobacteraceae bacterium]|nr:hypothetical protein [Bryobacteraceae bacterium]
MEKAHRTFVEIPPHVFNPDHIVRFEFHPDDTATVYVAGGDQIALKTNEANALLNSIGRSLPKIE